MQRQEISSVKFDIYIGKSYDSCICESDVTVKIGQEVDIWEQWTYINCI